ncbi:hypothetical protein GCM10025864_30160 [Luteimicrobium album]|uniref:DUF559 domain-containing protein n=1 Tax=Luteimicrobium album TaxID=1054550 RepID=A0ABQ6I3Q5_9MICO|nr:hypothetical protein [Luteimicrobium album]GMA25257.1 hypothetical protein GCM10025864_30160 [Luteimicrobium album]
MTTTLPPRQIFAEHAHRPPVRVITPPPRPDVPGLVRRDEIDTPELRERLSDGTLVRVAPGLLGTMQPDQPAWRRLEAEHLLRVRAVLVRLWTDFSFSHETAALLWGCWSWCLGPAVHLTQLTVPSMPPDLRFPLRRHGHALTSADRTDVDGVPVTSLERTVLDCLCSLPAERGLVIADSALRAGADLDSLRERADAWTGRRGIRVARKVLALADIEAESAGESRTRWQLAVGGLPRPVLAIPVETFLGWRWVDLGWPELKVGIEFDGAIKYSGGGYGDPGRRLFEEKRRHDALVEAGWILIRVTWADLAHPERLVARVRAALAAARRRTFR